jgi:hypothetical protein
VNARSCEYLVIRSIPGYRDAPYAGEAGLPRTGQVIATAGW